MASQTFTASDSAWPWPAGVTQLQAECYGGGGGSGGVAGNPAAGGGGAGGAYAIRAVITKTQSTLNVTVGAGGTAGSSAGANGGTGGSSSVVQGATTHCLAPGGDFGRGGTANSTNFAGGTGSTTGFTGDSANRGGNGSTGSFTSGVPGGAGGGGGGSTGAGEDASAGIGGAGGGGLAGDGANGVSNSTVGTAGNVAGGGASGGKANTNTNRAGAAGGNGRVVLTWADVFTATAALTAGGAEFAASATSTPPTFTATAVLVAGGAEFSASASASFAFTATASLTAGGAELAASGWTSHPHPVGILTRSVTGLGKRLEGDFSDKPFSPPFFQATANLTAGGAEFLSSGFFYHPHPVGEITRSVTGLGKRLAGNFAGKNIGTFTATTAMVAGGAEFASSATFTVPVYTATAGLIAGGAEFAASATFTVPVYTATAALLAGGAEFLASAATTIPTYTATAALVAGGAEFAATATFGATTTATAALLAGGAEFAATAQFASTVHLASAALEGPAGLFAASAVNTAPVDLLSALGAYYRLNGNLLDSSGADQHLTGTVTYATGKINQGLTNGDGARDPWTEIIGLPVSFSFWVKPDGFVTYIYFNTIVAYVFGISAGSDGKIYSVHGGVSVELATLTSGVFSHVVYTVDAAGVAKLYVDAVLVHTGTASPAAAFSVFTISSTATSVLDEVGIWGRVLTDLEIDELYNDGDGFDPTQVVDTAIVEGTWADQFTTGAWADYSVAGTWSN